MTVYIRELAANIESLYGNLPAGEMFIALVRLGVIDPTLCKVLAVREHVAKLTALGMTRSEAMWHTSEKLCCTYEYVRKCIYYYTDINLPRRPVNTKKDKQ